MTSSSPHPRTPAPRWMPIGDEADLCSAGQWWDAVRATEAEGRRAIDLLDEACEPVGPVILDPSGPEPRLYFLVPQGAATGWKEPGTIALGFTCHVVVPPAGKTHPPGLHWHHLPVVSRTLTPVSPLRSALRSARLERERKT